MHAVGLCTNRVGNGSSHRIDQCIAYRNGDQSYCECKPGFAGADCTVQAPLYTLTGEANKTLQTSWTVPQGGVRPGMWLHGLVELPPNSRLLVAELARRCGTANLLFSCSFGRRGVSWLRGKTGVYPL